VNFVAFRKLLIFLAGNATGAAAEHEYAYTGQAVEDDFAAAGGHVGAVVLQSGVAFVSFARVDRNRAGVAVLNGGLRLLGGRAVLATFWVALDWTIMGGGLLLCV